MSFLNRIKGEEPNIFVTAFHGLTEGKGGTGEYLTDYALEHGRIPGMSQTFRNIYIPYRGRTSEIDVIMLHENGILVFESGYVL